MCFQKPRRKSEKPERNLENLEEIWKTWKSFFEKTSGNPDFILFNTVSYLKHNFNLKKD